MIDHVTFTADLMEYVESVRQPEPAILAELRAVTEKLPESSMQISAQQGHFLDLLVRITGARNVIEVGVFTGYSSIAMTSALPDGGTLTAFDACAEWVDIAKDFWARAGVMHKIDFRLGDAREGLAELAESPSHHHAYDMAFIDADKTSYDEYYEAALRLVRSGGLIAFDNTLWSGKVADEAARDEDTQALRALNDKLSSDHRVRSVLLPFADGITLVTPR